MGMSGEETSSGDIDCETRLQLLSNSSTCASLSFSFSFFFFFRKTNLNSSYFIPVARIAFSRVLFRRLSNVRLFVKIFWNLITI